MHIRGSEHDRITLSMQSKEEHAKYLYEKEKKYKYLDNSR